MKKNMKKVILFKVPPTISFVKKVKLLISLKMPLKMASKSWKKRKTRILLKHPPSRRFINARSGGSSDCFVSQTAVFDGVLAGSI